MEELIFFNSLEGIKVSNTQFVAQEKIYSLQDVNSVHHGMIEPNRSFPTFCILMGSFLMIFEDIFMFVGGFSITLGMIAWLTAKTLYAVVIHTSDGIHQALTSESSHDVNRVICALNMAIINKA